MDRYIADELCGFTFTVNGFQTLFELIGRLQKQENLEKVPQDLPIFMVSGAEDPVGDYKQLRRSAHRPVPPSSDIFPAGTTYRGVHP